MIALAAGCGHAGSKVRLHWKQGAVALAAGCGCAGSGGSGGDGGISAMNADVPAINAYYTPAIDTYAIDT